MMWQEAEEAPEEVNCNNNNRCCLSDGSLLLVESQWPKILRSLGACRVKWISYQMKIYDTNSNDDTELSVTDIANAAYVEFYVWYWVPARDTFTVQFYVLYWVPACDNFTVNIQSWSHKFQPKPKIVPSNARAGNTKQKKSSAAPLRTRDENSSQGNNNGATTVKVVSSKKQKQYKSNNKNNSSNNSNDDNNTGNYMSMSSFSSKSRHQHRHVLHCFNKL